MSAAAEDGFAPGSKHAITIQAVSGSAADRQHPAAMPWQWAQPHAQQQQQQPETASEMRSVLFQRSSASDAAKLSSEMEAGKISSRVSTGEAETSAPAPPTGAWATTPPTGRPFKASWFKAASRQG